MDGEEGRQKVFDGEKDNTEKNPFLFIRLVTLTAISLFPCNFLEAEG